MTTKNQTTNSELVKADVVSFPVVGIGASAGGLEAFTLLLQHLPPDTGMGFVLVQHLDPVHESALTKLLSKATSMAVHEVTNNLPAKANHVYVIPPNTTLSIAHGVLKLGPRKQGRTPILFLNRWQRTNVSGPSELFFRARGLTAPWDWRPSRPKVESHSLRTIRPNMIRCPRSAAGQVVWTSFSRPST